MKRFLTITKKIRLGEFASVLEKLEKQCKEANPKEVKTKKENGKTLRFLPDIEDWVVAVVLLRMKRENLIEKFELEAPDTRWCGIHKYYAKFFG